MSDFPDVVDALRLARRATPGAPAVISVAEGLTATYAELDDRSDAIAYGLAGLGLRPGDRVALWLETSLAHVVLYLAAAKAGLVVVPVNERYVADEAAYILRDSGARALVFGSFAAATVDEMGLGGSLALVAAGERVRGSVTLASLEPGAARGRRWPPRHPDGAFILGYTSGTTGRPKGAVLVHRGVSSISRTNALAYQLPLGSVGIYTAAMTFTATVPAFILTHLYVAGTVVLCPRRDPESVIDLIARHRANYTHVPPSLVDDYAAEFTRRHDEIASLRCVLQGAGKVAAERLVPLNEAVDGRLALGWGMTENSGGLATVTTPRDMVRALGGDLSVLDSVGRPVPGAQVEVRHPESRSTVNDGSEGELVLRAPSLMAGYWDSDAGVPRPLDGGWYPTGDIGFLGPDGFVHLRERRQDLIVSGGMNVYPSEVEEVLRSLPGVSDCAVVGVPDGRWGQAVAAYVVKPDGAGLTEDQVVAHCRQRLASYKKPTRVVFGRQVPRTLSGKVKRFEVRDILQGAPAAEPTDGVRPDER